MKESPFEIRGILEGYYGVYYTIPERNDLIRFAGEHGYNVYVYGPKNDRHHRIGWREQYPEEVMDAFGETVRISGEAGVTFCYALSFGISAVYSSQEDLEAIQAKLKAFHNRGVRCFSVFLDDISHSFHGESDHAAYRTYAHAHVDVCNRLYDWLQALDPSTTLAICPTDYHGGPPFSEYVHTLGQGLRADIDVYYTGRKVCSPEITTADAEAFGEAVGRKPLIWDNYPVNDLAMRSELHIGPIRGRDGALHRAVKGVTLNPMNEAEASKVAILTYADYFRDPENYQPGRSWEKALRAIGGPDSLNALRVFADNAAYSYLDATISRPLEQSTTRAVADLRSGVAASRSEAVQALGQYLGLVDDSCYHLQYRMSNVALRADILPWIVCLESWVWKGRQALRVLEMMEEGCPYDPPLHQMEEYLAVAQNQDKRTYGSVLLPLAEYVRQQAELTTRVGAPVDKVKDQLP